MSYSNGSIYEGNWKIDLINNKGKYRDSSGNEYIGYFKAGKKHGRGTIKFLDGSSF